MRDRTQDILEATIREFIATGIPVSSAHLYDRYDFGIKPASIRIELTDLTDSGYLEQPHHAAGRVPSDRGYEFYAQRALGGAHPARSARTISAAVQQRAWDALAEQLASQLGAVSVVADLSGGFAITRGLPALVEHLDWESRGELAGILRDIEAIDQCIDAFRTRIGDDPRLFIGAQSPFGSRSTLATVAAQYNLRGSPVAIIAVGPKRMDYDRAAELFATLAHLVDDTT